MFYLLMKHMIEKMKFAKIFISSLIIIVFALAVYSLFLPDKYYMSRSVTINSDTKTIFNLLSTMKNIEKWNPWYALDTTITYQYEGNISGISSAVKWSSIRDNLANAYIRIDSINPDKSISMYFTFSKHGDFIMKFNIIQIDDNHSILTMDLSKDIGIDLPYRYYALTYNHFLITDFDKALNNIKKLCQEIYR